MQLKYLLVLLISVGSIGAGLFETNTLNAQSSRAMDVLARVSNFYSTKKNINTKFSINIINQDAGLNETQNGTLLVEGDLKYRLETAELIRVSNGEAIWTYFKNDEELQITEFDPEEEELTPAKIFDIYKDGFQYMYNGEREIDGRRIAEIDLIPEDPDNPYSKIRLSVSLSQYNIVQAIIYSRNGTQMIYKMSNTFYDTDLDASKFIMTKEELSERVEVIDLR